MDLNFTRGSGVESIFHLVSSSGVILANRSHEGGYHPANVIRFLPLIGCVSIQLVQRQSGPRPVAPPLK